VTGEWRANGGRENGDQKTGVTCINDESFSYLDLTRFISKAKYGKGSTLAEGGVGVGAARIGSWSEQLNNVNSRVHW